MSKYIDADLLKKDINRWKEAMADAVGEYSDGVRFALGHFTFVLDSLQQEQPSLPEDTVLFQKGVEEGRRLERDDNNKALAEMYGYEGGTESPLVKITFTIPKEHFKRLMPIKQGDVFGIENLTNKEGIR